MAARILVTVMGPGFWPLDLLLASAGCSATVTDGAKGSPPGWLEIVPRARNQGHIVVHVFGTVKCPPELSEVIV